MVSYTFLDTSKVERPVLRTGPADIQLPNLTKGTNGICIYGLFAMVSTVLELRADLGGRKLILLGDSASRLAQRPQRAQQTALILAYSLWAIADQRNVATRAEGALSALNPATPPQVGIPRNFPLDEKRLLPQLHTR